MENFILIVQSVILIFTLLIFAWQTRENIKATKVSQYQCAIQMMSEWRSDALNNPALAKHYESSPYFAGMFEKYGTAVFFHSIKLFHILEIFYLLHEQGIIDKEMWEGWKNNIRNLMKMDMNYNLWIEMKQINIYHSGFTKTVDSLISNSRNNTVN